MRIPCIGLLSAIVAIAPSLAAQCSNDHRDNKKAGILLTDMTISGTKTVSQTDLADMTSAMVGSCFDEDIDEMAERLRAMFQDHGYFTVEVKNVQVKPNDPLGVPRPVTMEADVAEGPLYRLGEITFVKNRAFTAEKLRAEFPLKPGELFTRTKVASGLESLRKLYGTTGYLDSTAIPETRVGSNAIIDLITTIEEGPQYRMGKVTFVGKKEATDRLQVEWTLEPGAVYDSTYVNQFIDANRALLPDGFTGKDVQLVKNCPKALVDVRVIVEDDGTPAPKDIECEKPTK